MIKFITYGDESFYFSKILIAMEAKNLDIFNEIKTYSRDDLPIEILSSSLMNLKKGGGYWLWKPYIIYKALLEADENDIIVYADSGCTLFPSENWNKYFKKLDDRSVLLFQYSNTKVYPWKSKNRDWTQNVKIGYWMKKSAIDYFSNFFQNNPKWFLSFNKMLGGVVFCKKDENSLFFFKFFFDLMLNNSELVLDPLNDELKEQFDFFCEHRHDQALLTPLAHYYQTKCRIEIMDEEFEKPLGDKNPAIVATRRRIGKNNILKVLLSFIFHSINKFT